MCVYIYIYTHWFYITTKDAEFGPSRYFVVSPHWVKLYKSIVCFLNSLCHVLRGPSIFGDLTTQVYKTIHILNTFTPKHKWFCFGVDYWVFIYVIVGETVTIKLLICRHSWLAFGALYGLWGLGRAEVQIAQCFCKLCSCHRVVDCVCPEDNNCCGLHHKSLFISTAVSWKLIRALQQTCFDHNFIC